MSTSVSTAFVAQYEKDVHHVFQRPGASLRDTVRTKDGVVGSTVTFQKIGKGTATTKARHGVITPMNQTHTAPSATMADFYAGDWVDKLDEAKINHDERMAIAQGGAWALGRKVDDQIITALDTTTQTQATVTVSSQAAAKGTVLDWVAQLFENDVPNDGQVYGLITAKLDQILAASANEYASADFVDVKPFAEGPPIRRFRFWNGVLWTVHQGLSNAAAASCKGFLFHKSAIGYGTGAVESNAAQTGGNVITADITWHGDRAAHFVNHWMSGGAVLIDDTGVIEGTWDDSSSVPTS
jgi:hypothetical protein